MKPFSRQTRVIYNPSARGEKALRFVNDLQRLIPPDCLKTTTGPGSARQLAAQAVRDGISVVAAAGGDGTVNEVINGLGDVPGGFAQIALAVIPFGTANVFAAELAIPSRPDQAIPLLWSQNESWIDLPIAQFLSHGVPTRRYFAQLAGAGFDARAVQLVRWNLKQRFGKLAYFVAAYEALRRKQEAIVVEAGDRTTRGEMVLIGNGRLYAGPYHFFPIADLRDGRVDACVMRRVNSLNMARCALAAFSGKIATCRGLEHFSAERLTLRSETGEEVPLQLDGELVGELPAEISVQQKILRVLLPER